jgi:hypothetical protein
MQVERQTDTADRRRARSSDPQQALSLQLSHVRDEAQLDALVLASPEGLPIAHAGDADLCCELAALAPLLSRGQSAANADIQQALLFVRAVNVDGEALYLASCGDDVHALTPAAVDRWLLEATVGVRRILDA